MAIARRPSGAALSARRRSSRRAAPLSPALARLVDVAFREHERVVRRIVLECRRRYPDYRALSGSALDGLRQNVRYLVRGFYQYNLIENRSPTRDELAVAIANARARVAQGVSLQAMIGAYQLALPILWQHLIRNVESDHDVLLEVLRRVPVTFASVNGVTTSMAEAYLAERERLMRSRGEAIGDVLRLLAAPDAPLATVVARAKELGLDLDGPRFAIQLRRPGGRGARRPRDVEAVTDVVGRFEAEADTVVGRNDDGVLVLLPADGRDRLLRQLENEGVGEGWLVGVGSIAADPSALRFSVLEARRAIELGALLRRAGHVYRYADLAVHDLVDVGSSRAQTFAQQTLGPLARPSTRVYRETLRALCTQGFRVKPAAAALKIHPHTLSYRMKRMRQRYGLDLADAQTRLRVALALLILGQ